MTSRNSEAGPPPSKRPRHAAATRQTILRAALEAFARSGYDGVGLRQIAAAAGVDPRMVGKYFGSKEELFAKVLDLTTDSRPMVPPVDEDAADRLLTEARSEGYLNGYLMTIRSTSNPQAVEILRRVIEGHGGRDVAARLSGPHQDGRAALLIAVNLGILLMKDILGATALTGDDAEELVPYLDAAFKAIAYPSETPMASDVARPSDPR